ncbi:MAG: elongation factor G [Pseudomonadota bacterium]
MSKKDDQPSAKVRNIGIMAHIDAGKTTVTERLLFVTGRLHRMGEVHDGQATMDWMIQEQERGITITSAVTTFEWSEHEIHLIDTPGHVDFTMEVERSLRVLDGVITVLDGVAGVEPQTETVWDQANKFGIPRLVFVNKLDRLGASFDRCVDSLRNQFTEVIIVPLQIPIGLEGEHKGVVDLLEMKSLIWDGTDPAVFETGPIPSELEGAAAEAREFIFETLSDHDDEVAELFLEGAEVPLDLARSVIRRETLARNIVPLLCGSALRNRGIPPLLDAIVSYLPAPADMKSITGENPKTGETVERPLIQRAPLSALAFKVQLMEDGRRMTYLRIYTGKLSVGETVLNATHGYRERVSRIFLMHSSNRMRIESIGAGNIVGVLGLKLTTTGDTLTDPAHPILYESIKGYEPVVHQALEPQTLADKDKLEDTLAKLAEEDPTFRSHEDKETGQRLIAGMGELHLEIIVDRLKRQFGLEVRVGKPQVVFRETISKANTAKGRFDRTHDERRVFGAATIKVEPLPRGTGVEFESTFLHASMTPALLDVCKDGAMDITRSGPVQGYQMSDLKITLTDAEFTDGVIDPVAYRIASGEAARLACEGAGAQLMEPIMAVEVSVIEDNLGDAISSINERKGRVEELFERGNRRVVQAKVPLQRMFGYSKDLRTRTQGRGTFMMRFSHYDVIE